jgi:hypothetical protein
VSGQNNVARQGCSALAQTGKQTIGPFNWLSPLVCGALATLFCPVTVYVGLERLSGHCEQLALVGCAANYLSWPTYFYIGPGVPLRN